MNTEKHPNEGRSIKVFGWPDAVTEYGRVMDATEIRKLIYHSEYYGDHHENWVLVMEGDKEVARYNTRFIETIVWLDDQHEAPA